MRERHGRASATSRLSLALAAFAAAAPPTRVAHAVRVAEPIRIDGRLDEPAWAMAVPIGPLLQVEPDENAPPSEETEVRVAEDGERLLFAIRCRDREASEIAATQIGRDSNLTVDDSVIVVLDTFADERNGFFFIVNPRGARGEGQISNNEEQLNFDWDGIWDAAARIDDEGWTAELAVPFKTLRFKAGGTAWGLNVQRRIQRRQETSRWAAAKRDVWISNLSQAGRLEGLAEAKQGRGLDLRPYLSAAREDGTGELKLGGDVFKNITPNLTAALTLNTDFAETEVDTRQVNLTRFPLFYPEKRFFFLEGAGVYEVAGLGRSNSELVPFYSRRIGLDAGREVPVLGGLKISGRVGRYNLGLLDVETGRQQQLGLGRQNLLAARVSRNLFRQSWVGLIATHGNPAGSGDNTLLGVDARFATSSFRGDKNLSLDLYALHTRDEASDRADHAWGFKLDYPNDLWDIALSHKQVGDAFHPALGFVSRNGIRKTDLGVAFMPRPGRLGIRQLFFGLRPSYVTDLEGRVLDWQIEIQPLELQTESGDRVEWSWVPQFERLDEPFEVRPALVVPPGDYRFDYWELELETAERRRVSFGGGMRRGGFYHGTLFAYGGELVLKPNPHVGIALGRDRYEGELPGGSFATTVLWGRLELNLSPDLGWSTLLQYDSDSRLLGVQSRLRWRIRPESDFFLVVNRGWLRERDGSYRSEFDRGSAKVQHTFRF
jgi:hypothetical protein